MKKLLENIAKTALVNWDEGSTSLAFQEPFHQQIGFKDDAKLG